jgi:hygromycin-B 7''-O-kinase
MRKKELPRGAEGSSVALVSELPPAGTMPEFLAVRRDEALLRPGVARLCRSLGVAAPDAVRLDGGTMPVYAAGDAVLKLYPPVLAAHRRVEAGVLAAVSGKLPVATPEVRAAGSRGAWDYLLMDRVPGVPLDTAWDELAAADRARLARQTGELIAALHRVPLPVLAGAGPDLPGWTVDWAAFLAGQRAGCASRQAASGLAAGLVAQIDGFLDSVTLNPEPRVLLHTEIMREHLFVVPDPWRLSGVVDFEPAMPGAREYEFVAVGCFVSATDARFLRDVLLGYGYAADELGPELSRRLLAWGLLHRYADLAWWLERMPFPGTPSLAELAGWWFGFPA